MKTRLACLTLAASALAAAPAYAADQNATLSATSPSFEWSGGPGSGVAIVTPLGGISTRSFVSDCLDTLAECEEILLKVETAATLTVSVNADDDSTDAIDVYLYPSDEAGEYDATEDDMADAAGATEASDETLSVSVAPGYYMARVDFYDANEDTYKGAAALSGFTPPAAAAPPPPPPTEPPPPPPPSQPSQQSPSQQSGDQQAARKRAAAKCRKKAKKIKNAKKRKRALKRCARRSG